MPDKDNQTGMNLNLSVPSYTGKPRGGSGLLVGLSIVIVVLLVIVIIMQVVSPRTAVSRQPSERAIPVDETKKLALRLENRGLAEKAGQAWLSYIESASLGSAEKAQKLAHAAELLQQAGKYEDAIVAWFRADELKPGEDLQPSINKGISECFTRLGKYADLYHELHERTALGTDKVDEGAKVVAEIGPKKVTVLEFERMLDDELQKMLAGAPPGQVEQYRKYYREQFTTAEAKQRKLGEMFSREVLTREGRERKVDQSPEFRSKVADVADRILAQDVMQAELGKIALSDNDYRMYYDANKGNYKEPENAKISRILLADEKAAQDLLATLKTPDDFAKAAKEQSKDDKTKAKGGEIDGEVRPGQYVPVLGSNKELNDAIFATKAGGIIDRPFKTADGHSLVLVREKTPEREKPYDEVKDQVKQDYDRQKQEEVSQQYIETLFKKHQVTLYPGVLAGEEPEKKE